MGVHRCRAWQSVELQGQALFHELGQTKLFHSSLSNQRLPPIQPLTSLFVYAMGRIVGVGALAVGHVGGVVGVHMDKNAA